MMNADELLSEIKKRFAERIEKEAEKIESKIASGKASEEDIFVLAQSIGTELSFIFDTTLTPQNLGSDFISREVAETVIPSMFRQSHDDFNTNAKAIQSSMDTAKGIGLKAVDGEYYPDRAEGIVAGICRDGVTPYEQRRYLNEPVVTNCMKYADDFAKKNARFRYESGMKTKIVRTATSKCCAWCDNVEGVYDYKQVADRGNDVFRRHDNCRCTVLFYSDKKAVDVYSKRELWKEDASVLEERKNIGLETTPEPTTAFSPAKTLKEAEDFIRTYVDDKQFGALGVSYTGVSVDVANEINKTISQFYEIFDAPKFGGIAAPAGNTKLGKMITNATAAYSLPRKSFLLNRASLKNMSTATKALQEEKDAIYNLLNFPERYDFSRLSSRVRQVVERSRTSGRATVPDTISDVINHELGHSLQRRVFDSPLWQTAEKNMSTFSEQISGYAGTDSGEYVAESLASYLKGESLIDPVMIEIFNSLKRK